MLAASDNVELNSGHFHLSKLVRASIGTMYANAGHWTIGNLKNNLVRIWSESTVLNYSL
jgi:hypothetical protein